MSNLILVESECVTLFPAGAKYFSILTTFLNQSVGSKKSRKIPEFWKFNFLSFSLRFELLLLPGTRTVPHQGNELRQKTV